jgi:hypothetical protein
MQLPANEKDDEQVVRVPEPLEMGATSLLYRKVDHDEETDEHDPTRGTRSGREIREQEIADTFNSSCRIGV